MTSTARGLDAHAALAAFERAIDDLLGADLGAVDDESLLALMQQTEVQRRRLGAVDARQVAEIHARGLAHELGARNTGALLSSMLRIDPGEARSRVAAAENLVSRTTLTGDVLEPAFPQLSTALTDGAIHARHAALIASTIDRLPVDVQATKDREIEADLLAKAKWFAPFQLAQICQRMQYLYDQDGTLSDDADRERRRELNYRRLPDGSLTGQLRLDPTAADAFETVMDAGLANVSAEERGKRTASQLRHDVLRDHLLMLVRTGQLPAAGGVTTTIVVTLTWEQWVVLLTLAGVASGRSDADATHSPTALDDTALDGDALDDTALDDTALDGDAVVIGRRARPPSEWLAVTNHGTFLTLSEVVPLLGDAQTIPVVLSGVGRLKRVEAYGDKHRIFSENQRLAMSARDHGCSFPGCTSKPAYCEAHHVIDHNDGGPTALGNGTLLCPFHHRTFGRLGYRCEMLDGVPHWIAPAWIDPDQIPQRNTAHDPAFPDP